MPFLGTGCFGLNILATVIAFDDPAFSQDRPTIAEHQRIGFAPYGFGEDAAGTEIAVAREFCVFHRK